MAVTDPAMPNTAPLGLGWLGDRRFDPALILGIPALGLRSEAAATLESRHPTLCPRDTVTA